MKKKLDLKILENADMKTIETLSYKYRAVDDKEAEKLFKRITDKTEDYNEESGVNTVEVYHRSIWRKTLSVAFSLVIIAVTAVGGAYFYSRLNQIRYIDNIIESETTSCGIENSFTPVPVNEEYDGDILGIKNWHIEKSSGTFTNIDGYPNTYTFSFINDDTGYRFAYTEGNKDEELAYLADLNNDGYPEFICNRVCGMISGEINYHTVAYRMNNGIMETASLIYDFKDFAEKNNIDISLMVDFTDRYYPDKNKIILSSRYSDTEYEIGFEYFSFQPANAEPVCVDYYIGSVLGVRNWHIKKESLTADTENTYFIDDNTGEIFVSYTGYKGKTSAYLTDLDKDQNPELVCSYQYGDDPTVMKDHVKIYRKNKGVLEVGDFLSDFDAFAKANNIELADCDDFSEKFECDQNRIILKKQGNDTGYELDMKYYHFKPVELQIPMLSEPDSDDTALN